MKNIAVFASGSGTNAENLIHYFSNNSNGTVKLILSNRISAGVLDRADRLGVKRVVFDRDTFLNTEKILYLLQAEKIDYIVLAGFLMLVPDYLIQAYPGRIVNIHPSLLPKYGGKGMYGGEHESGITIHHLNGQYDSGDIIAQYKVPVLPTDTPADVAAKVHALEYEYYPKVIENELTKF